MTDQEYLSRPLLEDVTFDISKDALKITRRSTHYIYVNRFTPLDIKALLNQYDEIRKLAKQQGVRISYRRHFRKAILENRNEYKKDCQESQHLFEIMTAVSKEIMGRGLHHGTIDDPVLKKLRDYNAKYVALFYRNRSISIIGGVKNDLDRIQSSLSMPDTKGLTIYL